MNNRGHERLGRGALFLTTTHPPAPSLARDPSPPPDDARGAVHRPPLSGGPGGDQVWTVGEHLPAATASRLAYLRSEAKAGFSRHGWPRFLCCISTGCALPDKQAVRTVLPAAPPTPAPEGRDADEGAQEADGTGDPEGFQEP